MYEQISYTDANERIMYELHPHFTWQIVFVISRCQSAAREDRRKTVATVIYWRRKQEVVTDSCYKTNGFVGWKHNAAPHTAIVLNLKLPDLGNVCGVRYCRLSLEREDRIAGKNISGCRCDCNFSGRYWSAVQL